MLRVTNFAADLQQLLLRNQRPDEMKNGKFLSLGKTFLVVTILSSSRGQVSVRFLSSDIIVLYGLPHGSSSTYSHSSIQVDQDDTPGSSMPDRVFRSRPDLFHAEPVSAKGDTAITVQRFPHSTNTLGDGDISRTSYTWMHRRH
ncbi:hypothetical protein J6590_001809 [Homalodisca vitripennis]|nr:hypothetical protein J6590_001809 [Homalodisca vitripennis]